jgi:hypothetical protein
MAALDFVRRANAYYTAAASPTGEIMSEEYLDKFLFDMVYQWGRVGLVVDYMAPAFQRTLNDIRAEEANKARTLIWGIGFDNDPTAQQLRKQLGERIEYLKSLNKVES